jgi:hypothetical protein
MATNTPNTVVDVHHRFIVRTYMHFEPSDSDRAVRNLYVQARLVHVLQARMSAVHDAAREGDLERVFCLLARRIETNTLACVEASSENRVHVLEYLHANGMPWTVEEYEEAEDVGHTDVVRFLRARLLRA